MTLYRKPGEPLWYSSDLKDWDLPGVGVEISKEQADAMGAIEETALEWEDVLAGAYDPIIAGDAWQSMDYGDAEEPSLDDSFQHLLKRPKFGFCFDILSMYLNDRALDYWIELAEIKEALAKFRDTLMEKLESSQKGISRSLVEKLARFNLCPALDKAAPEDVVADFSSLGKSDFVAEFDRHYWILTETLPHSKWLRAVDVVRVVLRLWPNKLRVSEGESLVLRQTHLKLHLKSWPFCELCWNLSEAAENKQLADSKSCSDRFCHAHRAGEPKYERLSKTKERFQDVCVAIRKEASRDEKLMSDLDRIQFASPIEGHSLERAVRYLAFQIAQVNPDQIATLVELAKLEKIHKQEFGQSPTDRWLGEQYGVSKQYVNKLRKIGGRIELQRASPLLSWWPARAWPPGVMPPRDHFRTQLSA